MVVLLLGARGFIGRHVASALRAAGHEVVCGVRAPVKCQGMRSIAVDFSRDHHVEDWLPRLAGIDAVINAVGILRERGRQRFEALHFAAPRALYGACEAAGVRKVIQLSALGADAEAKSAYHLSKRRADDALAASTLDWVIVQPSLVFGAGGASARLFARLAALPCVPVPGQGGQKVQPIHVSDLADALVRLLEANGASRCRLAAVGPRALTLRAWLAELRSAMGLPHACFVKVPMPILRVAAALARYLPGALLDSDTLAMLERGNVAPAQPITQALGHPPRDPAVFLGREEGRALGMRARLDWLLPLLRASVAAVWFVSGVVSLGFYPVSESLAMLERVGLTGVIAQLALYGAAALDIALALGVYLYRDRRWVWRAQIAVMAAYSVIIAWRLPELWLHPFGPLVKNLPLLAAIVLLHELEPRRDR